ncbi:MAG TPA: EAL domain-containing protein [Baekduia sp.]|jgi:diguanylate cyclase (GGDEF)-like protein/PAS domain S-box-containing protein|nr:EAL domain-containing protein [Baekduia sp.]
MARGWLPVGGTLPADAFEVRHRTVVWLLWLHVIALPSFAVARGYPLGHGLLDTLPIVVCAAAATPRVFHQRGRASLAALGLVTCSAIFTHLWGGVTEAHFHFFVVVALLSLYEDWVPWGLACAYVLIHHGLMGALDPRSVYGAHADAAQHPWLWALIHAGFIAALAGVNLVSWRSNELARRGAGRSEQRFRSAFDDAPRGMAIVDDAGHALEVNAALASATGYPVAQLVGRRLADLCPPADGAQAPGERRLLRADGTSGWALWTASPLGASGRSVVHVVDISVRKHAEHELLWRAHHDPLTGLPNRHEFVGRVEQALERRRGRQSGREADHVAVLFVDLDDFKVVNDSLGHTAGDRLLEGVAARLRSALRPQDVIARFGGDEFSVLLPGLTGEAQALAIVERLADSLRTAIDLDGEARFVTASVGLALGGGRRRAGATALLADADAAMYRAKELGKARCEVFDDSMRARAVERLELEGSLRGALARAELYLDYQPQVALPGGALVGVEALLRWRHPRLGIVSPAVFVPIAERTGQIAEIGAWVLREACAQGTRWSSEALEVAVNVSARQLEAPDFAELVRSVLDDTGLRPGRLCLEVTETALLADADGARAMLAELKAIGVRVAVDDFGVGHASLRHLRRLLPVDTLKIDKSFVDGVLDDPADAAIVEAVVRLAGGLGLECVAEGVEDAAQAEVLTAIGCHMAQGFHFARPMSPEGVAELLVAAPV